MTEQPATMNASADRYDLPSGACGGRAADGVAVDLNTVLLKNGVASPHDAVTDTVDSDETAKWYVLGESGEFVHVTEPPNGEIALLIRAPRAKEPAWHTLLRDYLKVEGFSLTPSESAGAILFVRTVRDDGPQYVAWCFGQGSRWLRKRAVNPRFGLLAALNALAGSAGTAPPDDVGVIGADIAARTGILRRASLTAAVPARSDAIPRVDTLADVLVAARVCTGHKVLGSVTAGRSLQFPDVIGSIDRFRELSALVADLASQDGYQQADGWIDHIVPETDEQVIETVLDRIWRGADDQGRTIDVDIAWWEDVRDSGSDHPATHWRLAGEHRERNYPSRRLTLTWRTVKFLLNRRLGSDVPGHEALDTDIRFFAEDEEQLGRCPIIELLSAEVFYDGNTYVLIDGHVCRVAVDYLKALDSELQRHLVRSRLVPYQPGEPEGDYNARAAEATGMLLLDKTDIRPAGMTQIEPCDLLGLDSCLYHVKRHSSASGISHLANQAVSSATVLLRRPESRDKLTALIQQGEWTPEDKAHAVHEIENIAASTSRPHVAFAIIGEWQHPTIKNLSLLSRLALRNAFQRLNDLSIRADLMLIDQHATHPRTYDA